MRAPRILLVDDDVDMCETLSAGLKSRGYQSTYCHGAEEALHLMSESDYDIVITDIKMPGLSGIELCQRLLKSWPHTLIVVMTAFGSLDSAVSAIRAGAFDYLSKPFHFEELSIVVARGVKMLEMDREITRLRQAVSGSNVSYEMIGESPAMAKLHSLLERIGDSTSSALILGESGSGKELVAKALHERSRPDGPFVAINCAAMPENLLESELFGHEKGAFTDAKSQRDGLFRKADGGTLFLDEIGEMPVGLQAKLLRAIQEKKVRPLGGHTEYAFDARFLAATNQDLEAAIEAGSFREDLYFRLNVIQIDVPPLRARGNDIYLLAQAFLRAQCAREGRIITDFAQPAIEKLLGYRWPGNIRELQNAVQRAVTLAQHDHIIVEDLPDKVRDYQSAHIISASEDPADLVTMEEIEKRYIQRVMEVVGGNKSLAAKVLGFDRKTLYRRLESYDIKLVSD